MLVGGSQKFVLGLLMLFALSVFVVLLKKVLNRQASEKTQPQN
jgi:hypothetical protein